MRPGNKARWKLPESVALWKLTPCSHLQTHSGSLLYEWKTRYSPRKKDVIDEIINSMQRLWTCVHRWNSISPSWTALISAYSSPNSQTSGYSHLSLSTFQLYSYYTVSSSFSPNYILFSWVIVSVHRRRSMEWNFWIKSCCPLLQFSSNGILTESKYVVMNLYSFNCHLRLLCTFPSILDGKYLGVLSSSRLPYTVLNCPHTYIPA